jgi:pyridoxal phosphate enzyme (YggS family)
MEGDDLKSRLDLVRERITNACARSGRDVGDVTLVAVTKGVAADRIRVALETGVTDIGENRVQEAAAKHVLLGGATVAWHLVGHLQSNKVRAALEVFDIIQSVDSLHLAESISERAPHEVPVFIQVNVAKDPAKSGFLIEDAAENVGRIAALPNLSVRGLMTIAPFGASERELRIVFSSLRETGNSLGLPNLSMGMSDDFETAIEEGATHVRIGRAIFGERPQ